jgi:hypothetical protein
MLASCILPHVECHTVRLLCSYSFFATGIPVVVSHHFGHFTVPVFLVPVLLFSIDHWSHLWLS